ncbi:nuclear transport factor 2 family protein [Nocardia sp. NBC_01327]|uniref:nuclear transport factor 2 family protein n=1 Tax=Nocardia sp. NBC_01327 TaxID=2903593 RepID=UPI002E1516D4|nr:nuclear transport factor 2 family protein [Nocardia sp. NBC_01327]
MTDEQQLWDSYSACWSADPGARPAALAAVAIDDVTYRDPGTEVGNRAELATYMQGFADAFPGHRFRIDEVLAHHDRSLARWTQVGAQGEPVGSGVSSARHHDGKLADITGFFLPAS